MNVRYTLFSALIAGFMLSSVPAVACDYTMDPWPVQGWPDNDFVDELPSNTFFVDDSAPEFETGGEPLEMAEDEKLSSLVSAGTQGSEGRVWLAVEMIEGAQYTSDRCSSMAHDCGFVVGPADDSAPSPTEVVDASVRWVTNGEGGGAAGCPDLDTMEIALTVSDDVTSSRNLVLLAFTGADEVEASTKEAPDYALSPMRSWEANEDMNPDQLTAQIILGTAKEHERSGEHFRQDGPFCFSIAAMDRSGNIGDRSAPICLDTTDQNDPYVDPVRTSHAQCSTQPSRRPESLVTLLLIAALMMVRRARMSDGFSEI